MFFRQRSAARATLSGLFVGAVGRPDLAGHERAMAAQLHDSVPIGFETRFNPMPSLGRQATVDVNLRGVVPGTAHA